MKRIAVILAAILLPALCLACGYRTAENIPYREGQPACVLDVSYVRGAVDRPVIIWFHGGGLTGGKKYSPSELLTKDYVLVSVEYRFYPAASVSEILDDAALATAWVVSNIKDYGGSASRIYLAGHSAGGYLVAMLGTDRSWLGKYGVDPDKFACIVPFSGQMMTHFTEKKDRGIPATQPVIDQLAPLWHIRPDTAPFLVVTGDRRKEMICRYEENALFVALMKHVGNKHIVLHEEDGFGHSGMEKPGFLLLMNRIASENK